MTDLRAEVVPVAALGARDRAAMLGLMQAVYDGVGAAAFARDLADKDECIVLRTAAGDLAGYSTQKFLSLDVAGDRVEGLFSGDTVIHPDHWGSPALFQAFAQRYVTDAVERWWFLISKGHRTYRMMPVFFEEFYPDRRGPTPAREQAIMDAYAATLYPLDYDRARGVLAYREPKDRLREELAGSDEMLRRNRDTSYFLERNPGFRAGHDLVCLARLSPGNIRARMREHVLGP